MKDRPGYLLQLQKRTRRIIVLVSTITILSSEVFSQISSGDSFNFLSVPVSARMSGMGGVNVSLADRDVNFFFANPALNGDTLSGVASASYQFYVGDIGHAGATFARKFSRFGMLTFGIQHMNYGTIKGYDASGNETVEFTPGETAVVISRSHQILNYRLGASIKGIFSNIAGNNASAMAIDIGGVFIHPKQDLTVGMVFRNIGFMIADYSESADSKLPFDVQVGTTFKPEHMPIRFSLTAYNLLDQTKMIDDPSTADDDQGVLKKIMSHTNFGAEILIHKNVNVLAGYNYLRHEELKLESGGGGAGITIGLSLNVKKFDFVLSRAAYVAGNAAYSFTLSRNINSLF